MIMGVLFVLVTTSECHDADDEDAPMSRRRILDPLSVSLDETAAVPRQEMDWRARETMQPSVARQASLAPHQV